MVILKFLTDKIVKLTAFEDAKFTALTSVIYSIYWGYLFD